MFFVEYLFKHVFGNLADSKAAPAQTQRPRAEDAAPEVVSQDAQCQTEAANVAAAATTAATAAVASLAATYLLSGRMLKFPRLVFRGIFKGLFKGT